MTFVGGSLKVSLALMRMSRIAATDALQARDEFISIVSHELKTPLTLLKLQAHLAFRALKEGRAQNKLEFDALEKMVKSSEVTLESSRAPD